MNPFFSIPVFFKEVKCPRCNRNQVVAVKTLKKGTACKFCGTSLPMKKDS